jgi:hypothetical protein
MLAGTGGGGNEAPGRRGGAGDGTTPTAVDLLTVARDPPDTMAFRTPWWLPAVVAEVGERVRVGAPSRRRAVAAPLTGWPIR